MALRKLPLHIQSIFHASAQIRTFKTAVEELVFNALDANSTSLAVRVNIQENYIQVVDNGFGVASKDFIILGQRYTTSKYEEPSCSKSNPKYGHSGQSLANLVEVSQSVKITSRCKNSGETWTKSFYNGKEEACSATASRPSEGTTVEIKGFLYNLSIQKKAVKPLQELHNIKTFLEQMSLVHLNTSITLRDNFENEVIFKIHKNRDIIQTLASVLSIETSSVREFQVEKNQYKVTGLIQNNTEESKGYHWLYVNERLVENSNLHKIVNENMIKAIPIIKNKNKIKSCNNGEEKMTHNKIPDYFIFITCPPNDYDIIPNPKQSLMEFKNLAEVNKLLEKLVKFYIGDIHIVKTTAIKEGTIAPETCKGHEAETRNKVKQIIQNILGTQQKKISGSALHNGVKGKMIKRKAKKQFDPPPNSKLKLKSVTSELKEGEVKALEDVAEVQNEPLSNNVNDDGADIETPFRVPVFNQEPKKKITKTKPPQKPLKKEKQPHVKRNDLINKCGNVHKEPVLSKFEKETDEVQKRCNILDKKVNQLLGINKKRKCKIFSSETVHYSNIVRDNKSISIRKKIQELIIHEYLPIAQNLKKHMDNQKQFLNDIKKSNDLIQPVVNLVDQINLTTDVVPLVRVQAHADSCPLDVTESFDSKNPGPTYESHAYLKERQVDHPKENTIVKHKRKQFISKNSRDNFASNEMRKNIVSKRNAMKKRDSNRCDHNKINNRVSTEIVKSSISIHFTETDSRINTTRELALEASDICSSQKKADYDTKDLVSLSDKLNFGDSSTIADSDKLIPSGSKKSENDTNDLIALSNKLNIGNTYTVVNSDQLRTSDNENSNNTPIETFSLVRPGNHEANHLTLYNNNTQNEVTGNERIDNNVIFISNTQHYDFGSNDIEPLTICEAVIGSSDDREEFAFIFDSINNVIDCNNSNDTLGNEVLDMVTNRICRINGDDNYLNTDLHRMIDCNRNDNIDSNNFNFKNRCRYIPKGNNCLTKMRHTKKEKIHIYLLSNLLCKKMFVFDVLGLSPMFENCNLKNICNYEFEEDYFEKTVYDQFAKNVQKHSEIFEPKIQNVTETTTRDIQKVDNKLNKDNASLTFNGESLRQATVLGQVDSKFIATIMKGQSDGVNNDCLVLFDQHAVHERIRLEHNMAEYITDGQWKSVSLDDVSISLTKDEMLYLHNHRDKFQKLGLQWSVASDTQVLVNAIPEAILGKHSRQVDVVLRAVKSLIKEEISIIKEQGGCVSLYPKSIMDLVFSEACRYAVMFGDALSTRECTSLVEALSRCGTPFQCAHGRPAMAVLVEVARETRPYTVNFTKVEQFIRKQKI